MKYLLPKTKQILNIFVLVYVKQISELTKNNFMKKKSLLLLSFGLAIMMMMNSCEPEALTPPNLTVTPAETVMAVPGEMLSYRSIVSSDTDLSSFEIQVKMGETLVAMADSTFPVSTTSAIIDFAFPVPDTITMSTTITFTFEARNESESSVVSRTADISIPYGEINNYTAVILSDIENPNGSSFFSLENNERMQLVAATAASEKVDIIYYYGASNQATLCAPADTDVEAFEDKNDNPIVAGFPTRNNTKLALIDMLDTDFNAIVNDGAITMNEPETTFTAVAKLEVGNILFAETVGGKKSLILVKDITGGQGTSEITIEVKIQK